ncbi:hypothetical protein HRbin12_00122 [bacterium HR12]|nr:hypothetical protein HRbin12_00122 [bacterium HR12]GIU98407.1 MAG: hypothetical protein KatS3mg014_0023 [Actinomycetota bacterium]
MRDRFTVGLDPEGLRLRETVETGEPGEPLSQTKAALGV